MFDSLMIAFKIEFLKARGSTVSRIIQKRDCWLLMDRSATSTTHASLLSLFLIAAIFFFLIVALKQ